MKSTRSTRVHRGDAATRTILLLSLVLSACETSSNGLGCPDDPATAVGSECSEEQLGCTGTLPIRCEDGVWTVDQPLDAGPDAPPLQNLTQGYHARSMVVSGVTYGYQIYIPTGYTPSTAWPVILFGHGAGERGSDNMKQLTSGIGLYVTAHQSTFPAIVVFPQIPLTSEGSALPFDTLRAIYVTSLDQTIAEVNADLDRVYLTGLSMGAFRSWSVAVHQPTRFAALLLLAGDLIGPDITGDPATTISQGRAYVASTLKSVPTRTFHGAVDSSLSPVGDREIAADFAAAGATDFVYREMPGYSHNVWDAVYADPATWAWLFAQSR